MEGVNLPRLAGRLFCAAYTIPVIIFLMVRMNWLFFGFDMVCTWTYFAVNVSISVSGVLLFVAGKLRGEKQWLVGGLFLAVCGVVLIPTSELHFVGLGYEPGIYTDLSIWYLSANALVMAAGFCFACKPRNSFTRLSGVFLISSGGLLIVAQLFLVSLKTDPYVSSWLIIFAHDILALIGWGSGIAVGAMFILFARDVPTPAVARRREDWQPIEESSEGESPDSRLSLLDG